MATKDHPEFEERLDCQVAKVDFDDQSNLRYVLQGVDLVISTISGDEQLNLIDAARRARVRLFVPSEFEGGLTHRPSGNDPLDRGSAAALEQLRHWAQSRQYNMQWTVFSCGILYERFAPGGLANYGMGSGSGIPNQGDYLVDVGNAAADIVEFNAQGRSVHVCMTSVADVAKFVAAAIEMGPGNWPREFKMCGDRMTVRDIFAACSQVRGGSIFIAFASSLCAIKS
jgi:nucleoside-diphosphate-sugar epimerase